MRNSLNMYMNQFRQDRQKQIRFAVILAALAVIVAGIVFWQLHSTGMAMTNEVFCGQEEHIHNADCYDGETLTCQIPEHTHTVECLIDETADVETSDEWEATLPQELTGVWTDDVTAVAESQLGYTESTANFVLADDGETRQGYTRYGAWYGNDYGDWDAMFVSFCLNYAGVPEEEVPESSGAYALAVAMTDMGICVYDDGFVPAAGNLVFFDTDEDEIVDGVGIVKELISDDTEITGIAVIEGNSNDAVEETEYDLNDPMIIAYGILPESPVEEGETDTGNDPDTAEIIYTSDGTEYTAVTLDLWIYDAEGNVIGDYDEETGLSCDVLIYMDPDSDQEYILIPASCFEETLVDEGYEFDDSEDCPIYFDIQNTDESDTEDTMEACEYDSVTVDGETEWYVRVSDTEEETVDRLDVYYIEPYAYTGEGTGKVVLNLGNGNGRYNNADYTHDRHEGTLLRYTTDSLADYADNDGDVTIHLPSDNDLDSTFTVVDANGSLSAVTFDLGSDLAYDYKLVGWVNIATGEYYDVSGGATTATVDLDNENVFYADWIAATYDHGNRSDANLRDDIVSTSGFVTIHMYDYNDLFNLYSESLVQEVEDDGTIWEAWTDSGNLYDSLPYGTGKRLTSSFIFVNNGTVMYSGQTGSQELTGGMLTWPNDKTDGNTWTGTGKDPRNATEIWGITYPYSAPMDMLFDPSAKAIGVNYVGEADYLFWIDKNGYYTYNSKVAAATYNQTDQRFYVYDGVQNVTNTSFSCFLPYNTYGESLNAVDGTVNYFFGMDMEVNFYLPNATGTKGGNQSNGEDMVFNFSGDDDILIFIDNELVLDMSGIHDEAFGSINFSDGTVTMGMTTDSDGNIIDGTTTGISLSSGTHDLKVYYMERGGYASNLEIQFNVVSVWEFESGEVQTVTADKTWVDAKGNEIDSEDLPDVYKESGIEVGLFDVLEPATEDRFGYTKDNDVYTVEFTDDSGVTRTYVYDASGPTLTYTEVSSEGTVSGTDDQVDSEGRVVDKDGYVVAWLDDNGLLYIRMDKQTLNSNNDWHYSWELLDPEGSYDVLELSGSSSYTTTSTSENLSLYDYWSIIGDSQIENSFGGEERETPLQVILTEAAQEASNVLGDTKDALGWVIVATENGITTQQVEFSQIATLEELIDEDSGQIYYKTIAGVTSQSEVDKLGSGAVWYVVDAGSKTTDANDSTLEDFYLYCYLNGTQYYLVLVDEEGNYTLGVTTDSSNAGTFCYDSLGELLVILDDGSTERVEIQEDGTITIASPELEAALDDIRIFTLQETETSGFAFTATNAFLPDFTLEKVSALNSDTTLAGVRFTLQDEEGQYYVSYDEDTDQVTWSSEKQSITIEDDGTYIFHHLPDGTYTLTETETLDGYNMLPSAITITIEGGEITDASWSSTVNGSTNTEDYVKISEDGLTITVENHTSAVLPNAGGIGTTMIYIIGGVMVVGAAVVLIRRRRING